MYVYTIAVCAISVDWEFSFKKYNFLCVINFHVHVYQQKLNTVKMSHIAQSYLVQQFSVLKFRHSRVPAKRF